jgi:hypothetical protein
VSGIIRVDKGRDNPYAPIPKAIFADARLSYRAIGVLCYLLSKPNNWETRVSDLVKRHREGREAVQASLKELEDAGYMRRARVREAGKFTGWETTVYESPVLHGTSPTDGFPSDGKPSDGFPTDGNPTARETEGRETDGSETLVIPSSSTGAVVPFKSEEEDKRAVTTRAHDLEQPYRARWFAAYQHPNARAAAIAILKASPALWVSIASLQGDTITHAQTFAGYLETFGLAAVMDAFTNSAQADPKGRAKYIKRCLENPIAQVGAVTVLPPVNIDDRKRQLQDELAAHFAELDKEFGLAAGGN